MTGPGAGSVQSPSAVPPGLPSRHVILRILHLIRSDAELMKIAEEFRQDPVLAYHLLRIVNSAVVGLRCEITSYHQAIAILGYKELFRWMTVLLIATHAEHVRPELIQSSLTRGCFLELIGKACLGDSQAEELFIVGAFSRLDVILGQRMESVLNALSLSEEIRSALLNREGQYGCLLRLAEAVEGADETAIREEVEASGVGLRLVEDSHAAAQGWVRSLPL